MLAYIFVLSLSVCGVVRLIDVALLLAAPSMRPVRSSNANFKALFYCSFFFPLEIATTSNEICEQRKHKNGDR